MEGIGGWGEGVGRGGEGGWYGNKLGAQRACLRSDRSSAAEALF